MSKDNPKATVHAFTRVSEIDAITQLINMPLPEMYFKWGIFPGIVKTVGQVGAWDTVGKTRVVHLSDGGSINEHLVRYDLERGWTNELTNFTDVFNLLVTGTTDEWQFYSDDIGTDIRWTWHFHARPGRAWLIRYAFGPLWTRYMQRVLDAAVKQLKLQSH